MKLKKIFCFILLLNISIYNCLTQNISGIWETYDGKGKRTGEIELYLQHDSLFGKITRAFLPDGSEVPDITCDGCIGERDGQKVVGMIVINGLKYNPKKDEYYGEKACFAPQKNLIANGKVWLDKNNKDILYLRGYLGPFYETQTWKRLK
ncbi:DUF2147 domain-containing protein [Bacteroidales bacterium OttesenSCG-928-K22]|nr:DUF2147 domain-containing protein [Bacteroidales bacterium OttesenSCG-928-K22]